MKDRGCVRENILLRDHQVRQLVKGKRVSDLGDILDQVIRELGMPRTLKVVWVGREKLDILAEDTLKDHWAKTNTMPITEKAQVMEILGMVAG